MRDLQIGEALYQKGDTSTFFYFVLVGRMHMTLLDSESKSTKTIEAGQFFGFTNKPDTIRSSFATAQSSPTKVIQLDTKKFQELLTRAQVHDAMRKIDFICRHLPGFRSQAGSSQLQEDDYLFEQEEYTKGYHIITPESVDSNLYLLYSGQCRVLLNIHKPEYEQVFPVGIKKQKCYYIMDYLEKG